MQDVIIGLHVKCPSCTNAYLETTKYFDPEKSANGRMFTLQEPWKGYGWNWIEAEHIFYDNLTCPWCEYRLADGNGKVITFVPDKLKCKHCGDPFRSVHFRKVHEKLCSQRVKNGSQRVGSAENTA